MAQNVKKILINQIQRAIIKDVLENKIQKYKTKLSEINKARI